MDDNKYKIDFKQTIFCSWYNISGKTFQKAYYYHYYNKIVIEELGNVLEIRENTFKCFVNCLFFFF